MTDVYPIIMQNCLAHHIPPTPTGGLDMSTESNAFNNLTTYSSTEPGCTEQFVYTGMLSMSLLYQKVSGVGIPSMCGVRMPLGGPYLSSTDITTIQNWINGGANP
jgi:hypothetical protein